MEDLVLKPECGIEENILKIIDYVKQYEQQNGLSEEEVLFKYSCLHSKHLAVVILDVLDKMYGKIKGLGVAEEHCQTNGRAWQSHGWVKFIDYNNHKCGYFDIYGRKTSEEATEFLNLLALGELELHNKYESRACRYAFADLWELRFGHIKIDEGLGPV